MVSIKKKSKKSNKSNINVNIEGYTLIIELNNETQRPFIEILFLEKKESQNINVTLKRKTTKIDFKKNEEGLYTIKYYENGTYVKTLTILYKYPRIIDVHFKNDDEKHFLIVYVSQDKNNFDIILDNEHFREIKKNNHYKYKYKFEIMNKPKTVQLSLSQKGEVLDTKTYTFSENNEDEIYEENIKEPESVEAEKKTKITAADVIIISLCLFIVIYLHIKSS